MTDLPAARPRAPFFSSGPCAKRPGWSLANLKTDSARPLAPREARQGAPEARHRPHPRGAGRAGRLPHRHRARLRHRRRRDGAVVDARRPPGRHAGLGKLRRGLGHGCGQAAQARRRPRDRRGLRRAARPLAGRHQEPRRGLHLERHHLRRARAERRLDRGRPRGPDDLRRHLGGLRAEARFRQARCGHLLLAEGAGRRGGARHADPLAARGRAARELQARLAAAEDLPHDQGRQAHRGHLRGRDHQHARPCSASRITSTRSNGRSPSAA